MAYIPGCLFFDLQHQCLSVAAFHPRNDRFGSLGLQGSLSTPSLENQLKAWEHCWCWDVLSHCWMAVSHWEPATTGLGLCCLEWRWAWAWLPTRKLSPFSWGTVTQCTQPACMQTELMVVTRWDLKQSKCPQVVMHHISSKDSFSVKPPSLMQERHLAAPSVSYWASYLLMFQIMYFLIQVPDFLFVKYPWGLLQ